MNWGILTIGHILMPPPAGFDGSSMEGVASTIHLLQPLDFVVPFLAHALGPFVGVLSAMFIAASGRKTIAIILGKSPRDAKKLMVSSTENTEGTEEKSP